MQMFHCPEQQVQHFKLNDRKQEEVLPEWPVQTISKAWLFAKPRFRILLQVQTFLSLPNLLSLRVHIWAWKEATFKDAAFKARNKPYARVSAMAGLTKSSMRLTRKRSERTETTLKRWLMCFSGLQHSEVTVRQQWGGWQGHALQDGILDIFFKYGPWRHVIGLEESFLDFKLATSLDAEGKKKQPTAWKAVDYTDLCTDPIEEHLWRGQPE